MTTSDDVAREATFSRRRLMGVAGGTTLGLAAMGGVLATPTAVSAETGDGQGAGELGSPRSNAPEGEYRAQAFPTATTGTEYRFVLGIELEPASSATAWTKPNVRTGGTGLFFHVLSDLPKGARITEVVVELVKDILAESVTVFLYRMYANDVFSLVGNFVSSIALPALPTAQYLSLTLPNDATTIVDGALEYQHVLYFNMTAQINAVRVGYVPVGAATFVPITPYRAYDSRLSGVPAPGILSPLTSRQVNVLNAIGPTGAVTVANVIPATARAITYNLTATGTTGDNYLAVAPGTAASTTVSSINFAANQSIANAATVTLDAGTVKVFCGDNVGSSHFILDVTGYYI